MAPKQSISSKSIAHIDLTDDEPPATGTMNDSEAETQQEFQRLRARLQEIEADKEHLALELAETKAELKYNLILLGKAAVLAARQKEALAGSSSVVVSGLMRTLQKRARSSSIETLDIMPPPSSSKKVRREEPGHVSKRQPTEITAKAPEPTVPVAKLEHATPGKSSTHGRTTEHVTGPTTKQKTLPSPEIGSRVKPTIDVKDIKPPSSETKPPVFRTKSESPPKSAHLEVAAKFEISPPASTLEVPRKFLRIAYGGSDQQFIQLFRSDKSNSESDITRRLVFAQPHLNPKMPSAPGATGLLYTSRADILENAPWTAFYKSTVKPALWKYMGEYENVVCGRMAGELFASQSSQFKKHWAKKILKAKEQIPYVTIRARVALQKAGHLPLSDEGDSNGDAREMDSSNENAPEGTAKEVAEKEIVDDEIRAIGMGKGLSVGIQDIIDALARGDEGINIVRMTCVNYDHDFANDIENKFPDFNPKVKGKETPTGNTKGKKMTMDTLYFTKSPSAGQSRRSTRARQLPRRMETSDDGDGDSIDFERSWR